MELKVDDTKTYTYGDWVRGTLSIGAADSCIREVQVELRGMISLNVSFERSDVHEETLYVLNKNVIFTRFDQSFLRKTRENSREFAIQFPKHKQGVNIPSTCGGHEVTCRHTITVKAVTGKHSKRTYKGSKELQFMNTESVGLLSTPYEVCNEQRRIGLSAVAVLELPPYLAQDGLDQKIAFRLLTQETTGLHLVNAQVTFCWYGFRIKPTRENISHQFALWDFKPKLEDTSAIEGTISLQGCNFPIYHSDYIDCSYLFEAQLNLFNAKANRYQSVTFSKPIVVLPTRLYKKNPDCWATKEEMRILISAREGKSMDSFIATGKVKNIEKEALSAYVPPYVS